MQSDKDPFKMTDPTLSEDKRYCTFTLTFRTLEEADIIYMFLKNLKSGILDMNRVQKELEEDNDSNWD